MIDSVPGFTERLPSGTQTGFERRSEAKSKEIAAGLVHGRYAEIQGAGHLTPLERPDELNEELLVFLQ